MSVANELVVSSFSDPPRWLAHAVFALLPADTRLRCVEVNRAWRVLLADTSLFACLDLSPPALQRFSEALFRAAVAKSGGQLRSLVVTDVSWTYEHFCLTPLVLEAVGANAATLTELRIVDTEESFEHDYLHELLETAPKLQLLEASALEIDDNVPLKSARAILRNEPPYQALRLRRFIGHGLARAYFLDFCLDLRCHASIAELQLYSVPLGTDVAMGAIVDACIALHLRVLSIYFDGREFAPATLSELARLVFAGYLRELEVNAGNYYLFEEDEELTQLFVAAVNASAMTRLQLWETGDWPMAVVEAMVFINARGHELRHSTLF